MEGTTAQGRSVVLHSIKWQGFPPRCAWPTRGGCPDRGGSFPAASYNRPFRERTDMGKGDKRSFKGKVFKGSFGKTRPRHLKKSKAAAASTQATQQKKK
jgi:ribosomal small subunit protein bTHX